MRASALGVNLIRLKFSHFQHHQKFRPIPLPSAPILKIEDTLHILNKDGGPMRIYQAGPLFSAAEIRWHKDFKKQLGDAGYDVLWPGDFFTQLDRDI